MGKRLSKIVTRTGDDGTTGLTGGDRVSKASARIEAIGTVDELNCFVGVFVAELDESDRFYDLFRQVQNDLFDLGGELSMPGFELITSEHVDRLEDAVESINEALPPLTNFILPGGSRAVSSCHVVRAVARRAERRLTTLSAEDPGHDAARHYLNRLSDLAFVVSRALAADRGEPEVLWQQTKPED